MSTVFQRLIDLFDRGMQPRGGQIFIGLGFLPQWRNALALDPKALPPADHFKAIAGLNVIFTYHGDNTGYRDLRRVCGYLYAGAPRSLLLVDVDTRKIANLRVAR